jgi:hypothetical protein
VITTFTLATPAFFDLAGASAYLGGAYSIRTLRRLIGVGELPFYLRGRGKILIKKDDLTVPWPSTARRESTSTPWRPRPWPSWGEGGDGKTN